ncbi:hypothetical protein FB45DRAFT_1055835 [Roridomyces roridus]|uniref:Uncharacterized protein n=1 Tax=Roridomyces roridus TaxID=1738132 RepID=A0AAD7C156_9AGAR|nr:hypothetical protein FB45DRAFT_1055835 [Roridomyces roridus]
MKPDVALELKLHIADHLPKAALASICATSRMHHVQLMPSLYSHIEMTHDEDGMRRGILLLKTLCLTSSSSPPRSENLSAYPAALVRELKLWLWFLPQEKNAKDAREFFRLQQLVAIALSQTVHRSADGQSLLRVLHLYSNVGFDAVTPLLNGTCFGCLEDFLVCAFDLEPSLRRTGFQFLQVPGLKSIVQKEPIHHGAAEGSLVESFLRSLNLMPSASPGLTTLHIDLTWTAIDILKIISALNSLHLPNLEAARLRLFLDDLDDGEDADFRPFLAAHPSLRDVSVPLGRMALPQDTLPLLQVFAGHTHDFLKVCDGTRPLQQLVISLYDDDYAEGLMEEPTPIANADTILAALVHVPHLSRLALVNRPIHYNPTLLDDLVEDEDEEGNFFLSLSLLQLIVQRAPRLTHLEFHIKTPDDLIALRALTSLEWLKIHTILQVSGHNGSGIYTQYLQGVGETLNHHLVPVLPQLLEVVVGIIGVDDQDGEIFEQEAQGGVVYNMGHVFRILPPTGDDRRAVKVGVVTYTESFLS